MDHPVAADVDECMIPQIRVAKNNPSIICHNELGGYTHTITIWMGLEIKCLFG